MRAQARSAVRWLIRVMAALAALAVLICWGVRGMEFARWVGLGGAACIALTWLFAVRAFSVDAGEDARGAMAALVKAEGLKLALAVTGFVLLARTAPEHFGAVMIGFCAALTGYWFALPLAARTLTDND